MFTWLTVWPLLLMPTVAISLIALFPTIPFNGSVFGGGPFRQFLLNNFLLPFLSTDAAESLVRWFSTATVLQEWLLSFCVAININALLLPILYYLCESAIRLSSWYARKNLDLKRGAIR